MSVLQYLVAASSQDGDLAILAGTSVPAVEKDSEDIQRGRRRKVWGDTDSESDSQQTSSPHPHSSGTLQAMLAEKLPQWGDWLPSLPRMPYWVTSIHSPVRVSRANGTQPVYWRPSGPGPHSIEEEGTFSPAANNNEGEARGMMAYILVASGEDVRPRGITLNLTGEVRQEMAVALPMVGSHLLQFMVGALSFCFIGHLGTLELAGSVLAVSLTRVTGHVVLVSASPPAPVERRELTLCAPPLLCQMGLGGGLELLYGQGKVAYSPALMGVYLQRALLVLTLACLPIAVLWCYTEPLLLLLRQAPQVAAVAGEYAVCLLPSLLANAWIQPTIRYLQQQKLTQWMDAIAATTLLLHTALTWALMYP